MKRSSQILITLYISPNIDLPRDHPESYHHFMYQNFFQYIDIDPKNVHILDGNASDLSAECQNFEDEIQKSGGVDLCIAGIGPDGHIAFNEPGSSLVSRTRIKTLTHDTLQGEFSQSLSASLPSHS